MPTTREALTEVVGEDEADRILTAFTESGADQNDMRRSSLLAQAASLLSNAVVRRFVISDARADWWSDPQIPSKYKRLLDAKVPEDELQEEQSDTITEVVNYAQLFVDDVERFTKTDEALSVIDAQVRRSWDRYMSAWVDVGFLTGGRPVKSGTPLDMPLTIDECVDLYVRISKALGEDAEPVKRLNLFIQLTG